MLILPILLFVIILSILIYTIIKAKQIPKCLSDCYYVIGNIFITGLVLAAFVLLPAALTACPNIFAFLMCSGIAFVGVAANYKDSFVMPVHKISALISGACSIVFTLLINPIFMLCMLFSCVSLLDRKNWLLYCELSCFITAYASLINSLI